MKAPDHPGDFWARGIGVNADLGWTLFVADFVCGTHKVVVRISHALHTRYPWFTPSPRRWTDWKESKHP